MNKLLLLATLPILLLTYACDSKKSPASDAPSPTVLVSPPDETYAELFEAVQMEQVFPDGKTFADCTPRKSPEEILAAYRTQKGQAGFGLRAFVSAYFDPPVAHSSQFTSDLSRSVEQHINSLWPVLTRQGDTQQPAGSTLLPLPKPYVVPGGRFGEIYYWDSYFTMLGLQTSGRTDLIQSMVDNFAFLIRHYGHIPNGNRSYYLSRSQPPFFSMMVALLQQESNFLTEMEKEYQFWMDGAVHLTLEQPAYRRVVRMPSGTVLNRYWDDRELPRPESYREDRETADLAASTGRNRAEVYRHIRAAAESGWDFSSRWGAGQDLSQIATTDIIPIDLNCLLWHLEIALANGYTKQGNKVQAELFNQRAQLRAAAIVQYCWNAGQGIYMDYNWPKARTTGIVSAAGVFPAFMSMGPADLNMQSVATLERELLRPGGVVATSNHTGQQWDAPNGWAPLQWVAFEAAQRSGRHDLAANIQSRWVALCTKVYQRTGKMLEKYNVEDLSLEAGGGEYPVQDGFGWSNGVLLKMMASSRPSPLGEGVQ
jgi:alpha,alpha-trehalase